MQIIGQTINPTAIKEFANEVKTAFPQFAKAQFINSGKLQTTANLGDCLLAVQEIAAKYRLEDMSQVAAADWSRIDRKSRYNAAVIRNQAKALRLNK